MGKIRSDVRVYWKCPEIRSYIRRMYMAKAAGVFTLILMTPLIVTGFVSAGIVYIFTVIGDWALKPVSPVTNWLQAYQKSQIHAAHSKLSLTEIQERTKQNVHPGD
jgi:hypothetical protein